MARHLRLLVPLYPRRVTIDGRRYWSWVWLAKRRRAEEE